MAARINSPNMSCQIFANSQMCLNLGNGNNVGRWPRRTYHHDRNPSFTKLANRILSISRICVQVLGQHNNTGKDKGYCGQNCEIHTVILQVICIFRFFHNYKLQQLNAQTDSLIELAEEETNGSQTDQRRDHRHNRQMDITWIIGWHFVLYEYLLMMVKIACFLNRRGQICVLKENCTQFSFQSMMTLNAKHIRIYTPIYSRVHSIILLHLHFNVFNSIFRSQFRINEYKLLSISNEVTRTVCHCSFAWWKPAISSV